MAFGACWPFTMSSCVELRRARPLLGTIVEICARAKRAALARIGMMRAFDTIAEVQRLMSFHEATSDVSRLNREAFRKPVQVHAWTWHVLACSQEFSVQSRGAFDLTIAPLLSKWGYLPMWYETDKAATFRDIILLPDGVVRFARPLSIDLGGIAKGFAVDCAVEALRAEGVECGIVNAGGDLRAFGDEAQEISLRDPAQPGKAAGVVSLQNRAIATSGVYYSRKMRRGVAVSPLIHGRTRRPFVSAISVAVSAPNCLTADALTKIVLARGEKSCAILRACEADAVILERGKTPRVFAAYAPKFR
jgi:thiamine biosynthesis lipoprotein